MTQNIHSVGCDKCGYYVEFEGYQPAKLFVEETRNDRPFNCTHEGIAVVRRSKDLDFR